MARNKHPEETVQKILEVSYKLFSEKGYDRTTIADIVDALGMSKGAVYHHFKSKEDILDRITDEYYNHVGWLRGIRTDESLTGLERLRQVFFFLLSDREKLDLDHVSLSHSYNDRIIALVLRSSIEDSAPIMQELIELGNADGSLHVAQPKEMAEALMVLINMWMGVFSESREDFMAKLSFLREMTGRMGLPLFDDALLQTFQHYWDTVVGTAQT